MKQRKENQTFRILSAIGIILVVAGHLGYPLLDWGGLFPYYSFHVFIFLFVSGYFYREEEKEQMGKYLLRKCKTLLFPYFLWNFFYGLITMLLHKAGFTIGQPLSLYTLFVAPFEGGHHFMYHFPAWFVPALFLVEVVNVVMRKILSLLRLEKEWLIFIGCLLMGMLTVSLAIRGHIWGYYRVFGRILLMLPGFQMGRFYGKYLEKHDRLPNRIYFPVLFAIQLLLVFTCGGLAFSTVWVTSFANGPLVPYLTVMTGIALWLRIAKIMAEVPSLSKSFAYLGRNTFGIMMHHIFSFFLLNCLFFGLQWLIPGMDTFEKQLFFNDVNYLYLPMGDTGKWLYLLVGIGLPLLCGEQMQRMKRMFMKRMFRRKI